MALSHSPSIVTDGLVLCLDAANLKSYPGSGSSILDLSNQNNNGSLSGIPTFLSSNGGIFSFDGTDDIITTTTQFNDPEAYSLILWFRTSNASGKKLIGFENTQTGINSTSYDRHVYINTNGNLVYGVYNSGYFYATTTITVNDNIWHCLCVTYGSEGSTARLYVDGISRASVTLNGNETYSGWWKIGGYKLATWSGGSDGYFIGNIGQIMVYNRGLAESEVLQNFNALRGRYNI